MQAHAEDFTNTTLHAAPSSTVDKVRDDDDRACTEAEELEQLADRVSAARSVY